MKQTEQPSCRTCSGIQKAVRPSCDFCPESYKTRGRAFGPRNRCGATVFLLSLLAISTAVRAAPLLDPQACKNLSAAYQPGVDVHGKPVAPADLNAPVVAMPEKFSFDINIDAAKAVGLPVPPGTEMQAKVGTVTYDKGVLTFDGKPLDSGAEANIKALCVDDKKPAPTPAIEKQQGIDVVD